MSIQGQVARLISEAENPEYLSRMYSGWRAYIWVSKVHFLRHTRHFSRAVGRGSERSQRVSDQTGWGERLRAPYGVLFDIVFWDERAAKYQYHLRQDVSFFCE